ncbi:MAG: hypothetical protein C5B47_04595 [Verrucomicrobia bacterium]|nr:MAG: hypothetical protein C5B47_04595 [Verrucomicrobiota bacterium]
MESEIAKLGLRDRVRVLGFVNDSQLPGAYKAADLFVLPSEYDPCPLVVPEAMFTGLPVLLSDAVLGRLDMITPGETGYTYRCGDEAALSGYLRQILQDRVALQHLKEGVARRMERWTGEELRNCWVSAVERGLAVTSESRQSRQ